MQYINNKCILIVWDVSGSGNLGNKCYPICHTVLSYGTSDIYVCNSSSSVKHKRVDNFSQSKQWLVHNDVHGDYAVKPDFLCP